MIKLLAVDMDGTCLDSKGKMPQRVFDALKKASESGVIVVPTTGRNINCLPVPLKNQSFYRYIISSNGALVVDTVEDKEIFKAYIDSKTGIEILKKCRRHLIFSAAHIDRDYYVQGKAVYKGVKHYMGDDASDLKIVRSIAKTIKEKGSNIEEFQFFYFGDRYKKIIKKIIAPYPDVCSAHASNYAEVFNKNGSKGNALLALADHLGITADEIACIGDEENDVSMFKVAGTPLAMGNAIDQLKTLAKHVLPTNDEGGVAVAIEKYVLR